MRCHCCRRAPSLQRPPHNACTRSRDALVCAFDPPEICPFALFRKPWQKMDLGRPSLRWLAFLHLEWIWDLYIYFLPSHECLIWVWIDLHSWPSGRQDPSLEHHRVGPVNLRNLYFARFAQEQHKLRWRPWPGFLCKEIILISVLLLPWLLFGWKSSSIRPFPLL
ncbi:uncharacterized protein LOC122294767 isoform X2 [Carya illinoinensis]|uniref:uncharacterized protein LOC122294767 isoform X2 n=1 Tax=Carya illinoinensis TaxID=32201 RepID=UPI001C71944D|nr:uncharacterized protein LOC122294767 isoform X2 [Carya illinoinensis]